MNSLVKLNGISLKKDILKFRKSNKKLNLEIIKLSYKLKTISIISFIISFIIIILGSIKNYKIIISLFIKANTIIILSTTSTLVIISAVLINLSYLSKGSFETKNKDIPEKIIVADTPVFIIPKKVEPKFQPKFATVIKLDGTILNVKILIFTKDYISIEVEDKQVDILQQDIYKIIW